MTGCISTSSQIAFTALVLQMLESDILARPAAMCALLRENVMHGELLWRLSSSVSVIGSFGVYVVGAVKLLLSGGQQAAGVQISGVPGVEL